MIIWGKMLGNNNRVLLLFLTWTNIVDLIFIVNYCEINASSWLNDDAVLVCGYAVWKTRLTLSVEHLLILIMCELITREST